MESESEQKKQSLWQVLLGVLSAAVGVQSNKNRERDFETGNFKTYLFVGLLCVALFICTLLVVVSSVLGE